MAAGRMRREDGAGSEGMREGRGELSELYVCTVPASLFRTKAALSAPSSLQACWSPLKAVLQQLSRVLQQPHQDLRQLSPRLAALRDSLVSVRRVRPLSCPALYKPCPACSMAVLRDSLVRLPGCPGGFCLQPCVPPALYPTSPPCRLYPQRISHWTSALCHLYHAGPAARCRRRLQRWP